MNSLHEKIIERIRREGPITFEAFMEMALYYPGLGYYTSVRSPVGREGDFYTGSHLNPVFGAMFARQFIEMWEIMGQPPDFCIVEIGAGAGFLCRDSLDYLKRRDLLKNFSYIIVEPHPARKDEQADLLKDFTGKVSWVDSLEALQMVRGCVVSNELLDAFPVHIVEMQEDIMEIYVDIEEYNFIIIKQKVISPNLINYFKQFIRKIPQGYRTEINLRIKDWIGSVSSILSSGFVCTVDYGYTSREYYADERSGGTLLCYHRHRVVGDPFLHIGKQDITAHVNFSSLSAWGDNVGLETIGYAPQGPYLVALGIDEVINELDRDSLDYLFEITRIKNLILPEGMGETHKVCIQYKGKGRPSLGGFSLRNEKDKL